MHLARDCFQLESFPRLDRLFDTRYRVKPQVLVYGCNVTVIITLFVVLQIIRRININKIPLYPRFPDIY